MTALGYSLTPHQDHQDPVPPECRIGFTSPLVTLPLVKNKPWPLLPARINNRLALDLILDTGASFTILEARDAIRAGVRVVSTNDAPIGTAHGNAGDESVRLATIDLLTLGELRLTNVASVVLLQEASGSFLFPNPTPAVNMLGMIPLSSFAFVTIDYPAHQVVFSPQQEFQPPAGSNILSVPLILGERGLEYVTIHLPGGYETNALVDTGAHDALYLDKETIRRAGLESAMIGAETNRVSGIGEQLHEDAVFKLDSFGLGGRQFRKVWASTGQVAVGNRLGSGFLRWFRVTFDFKRSLLWIEGLEFGQPAGPANAAPPHR